MVSDVQARQISVSYDGGKNYNLETKRRMLNVSFFLSDNRFEHTREVMNIILTISKFGGLWAVVFQVWALIGMFVNN